MLRYFKRLLKPYRLKILALSVGKEFNRIRGPDRRDDLLIVDLSHIEEDLVGVRRRVWFLLGYEGPTPEFDSKIEYISLWEI
jgi:hypothetical protein